MKNNKKILAGIGMVTLAGAASVGAYSASAYQGDYSQKGPNYSEERHIIMEKAFDTNDYNSWKAQMDKNSRKGRVADVINEGNFPKFAEAHKLAHEGQLDEADEIRKELGLRTRDGKKGGHGYGKGNKEGRGNGEHRGENRGGKFVDENKDGQCDNIK